MAYIGMFEVVIAFLAFLILGYYLSKNNNNPPSNWPILGMLPGILVRLARFYEWHPVTLEKHGGTFLFIGPWFCKNVLMTADPANIRHIMVSNFPNYPKGPEFRKIFDILGDGIFNADSDLWKKQRKLIQTHINNSGFYQFLVKTSQKKVESGLIPLLDHVCDNGLVVDLQDLFQRFAFDATCTVVTGFDPGSLSVELPEVEFCKAVDDVEKVIVYRHVFTERLWKMLRWLKIGEEKKLSEAWKTLDRIVAGILSRKKGQSRVKPVEDDFGVDLLKSCMDEKCLIGLKPDDKFLRDMILNLLIAGRDPMSVALSWFFYVVSTNPQVEMKIREELRSILPQSKDRKRRLFDVEEIKDLVYLHASICETLRLYPPVPFQHKKPVAPDTLPSGHQVSLNTKIYFSLYAMGRMSSVWGEDCLEFKPERWINEGRKIRYEPTHKFLAFNSGPRTCLGRQIAFIQMKAVAAAIIYNYQVEAVDNQIASPVLSIILHIKNGLKVKFTKRFSLD